MSNPPFDLKNLGTGPFDYQGELGKATGELNSAIAGTEWSSFLAKRKELLDIMMQTAMPTVAPHAPLDAQGNPTATSVQTPLPPNRQPSAQQLGQAHFWGIERPEDMPADQLQILIDQRRAEVPRAQETSVKSALLAGGAAAAQAAASGAQLIGNAFQNLGKAADDIPLIGPALNSMLNGEQSKMFWQSMQSAAANAVEGAFAQQPKQDFSAFQFLTGVGKMAGYAIPAVAAWEGLGAIAGIPRLSWLAQSGTPLMRAAVKGGLISALANDPDAPVDQKVMNIGLGAILGGASMWGGRVGASVGLGTIGAGVGASVGDTPEERTRNAVLGAVGAASLPFLAPAAGAIFGKVREAFPGPNDGAIPVDQSGAYRGPGEVMADYTIENGPQISANPPAKQLGIPQTGLPAGPSTPEAPQDLSALFREMPSTHETQPTGTTSQEPATEAGPAPRIAGYLETPGTSTADPLGAIGGSFEDIMSTSDRLVNRINPENFPDNIWGYRRPGESVDATVFPQAFASDEARIAAGYTEVVSPDRFAFERSLQDVNRASAARYDARRYLAKSQAGLAEVSQGPAHLLGSKVAATDGTPLRVYHGTPVEFDQFDLSMDTGGNLYGRGIYHTEAPQVASGYTQADNTFAKMEWVNGGQSEAAHRLARAFEQSNGDAYPNDPHYQDLLLAIGSHFPDQGTANTLQAYGVDISDLINPTTRPNIRPALLDIKNPYNVDQQFTLDDAHTMVDQLAAKYPGYNWNDARNILNDHTDGIVTGDELYKIIESRSAPIEYDQINGLDIIYNPDQIDANEALRSLGFDGVTHIGGGMAGGGITFHRVWIAFNPEQVHPYFSSPSVAVEQAAEQAAAITKQATVMESQDLAVTAHKAQITEADVVQAAKSANPGGQAIIKSLGDPMAVMQAHPDVKFVQRPDGKLDGLIGEFSDQQIADYQKYGLYEGNKVHTASGVEGEVMKISPNGFVTLRRVAGGPPLRVKIANVFASRYGQGAPTIDAAEEWDHFKYDLLGYLNGEAKKAGMAPIESIWDARVPQMMQQHLENYMTRKGITSMAERQAMDIAINDAYVNEARSLDPESRDMQARLGDQAIAAENEREASDEPIAISTEEQAASKGFVWIVTPEEAGGMLRDNINPEGAAEIPFETEDAAVSFLHDVDRSAPDITPASDVPAEVMESAPTEAAFEPRTGSEEETDTQAEDATEDEAQLGDLEAAGETNQFVRRNADGTVTYDIQGLINHFSPPGGGGSGGPPEPPTLGAGGFNGGLPPGPQATVGSQFRRLYHEHPEKWAWLERRWGGNHLRYTRYLMASLEHDVQSVGVDMARPWRDYEALETARVKSDNEAYDWLKEHGEIMREFPKPLLREGFVTRTHEIVDDTERYRQWWGLQKRGYSEAKIKKMIDADNKLTDFYHRLFISGVESPDINFRPEQEITRYISHVRARQAQGPLSSDWYNPQGLLSPQTQFFAEFAREGNVQFRVMDARTLGNYYVRSMMFKKYQADPYNQFVETWQDPRIPRNISQLMVDHARSMRFGYRPEPTLATKAIQGVVEGMLGVPITQGEAAQLGMGPLGWMYRSLLGGRTSIFFRDATQPLMALAKVRTGFMAGVYKDILGYWRGGENAAQVQADYQQALKAGWVTRERAPMEAATTFEAQPGADMGLLGLTPEQQARRETVARIGDVLLPSWLQRIDDKANTLRLYGREQRLNQFIPGLAAHRQATAALGEFREGQVQAALSGDASKAMTYEDFAKRSFFSSFEPAIQQRLRELVESGDDEEAANLFARQVVNWSQQVYTTREKPKALRGGFGRLASFLGNWTGQFVEGAYSAMRWGEPQHIARALAVLGGFSYAMTKMGQKLGLRNLSNWAWSSALHYAGSPIAVGAANALLGYQGLMNEAEGRPAGTVAGDILGNLPSAGSIASDFIPYTGYLRSASALSNANQGPRPITDAATYLVTGDNGPRADYARRTNQRAQDIINAAGPKGYIPPSAPQAAPAASTAQPPVSSTTIDARGRLAPGQVSAGNINLYNRPIYRNPADGSISTVRSISIGVDGGREVLIPTVSEDGKIMTTSAAVKQYMRTGRHLGVFKDTASANAYAQALHEQQQRLYGGRR